MGDAGFFRGTSSEQDGRFSDKEKKLLKQMRFEDALERKINMEKIDLAYIKPWITMRLNEILGMEDDVVIEYVMSQLEEKTINPKIMQINITGFLNARRAREFMGELWVLLVEADEAPDGIPRSLVDKKMNEMKKESTTAKNGAGGAEEKPIPVVIAENDWQNRYKTLSGGQYSGPTKEKPVSDDRIVTSGPRRSRSPRRGGRERDEEPARRREFDEREKERDKEREQRRLDRREDEKKREAESKRREEERVRRRAEEREREREREKQREEDRLKRREEERARERDRQKERERERRRRHSDSSSGGSKSPVRRRFTEGTSSASKRKHSPSDSEDDDRKKRKKKHSRRSSDDDDDERRERKEKKSKKHKKEKKKKERKRSPSSCSDTE